MTKIIVLLGAAANFLALNGCAGITVEPITSPATEKSATGFRYYENANFLFVHTNGKGGLTSEIITLPDTTREMSAHPYAVLASNNTTLSFTNGVLTEANAQVDTTAVVSASMDALAKFLSAAVAFDEIKAAPPPYLYKIYISSDGVVTLTGGPPLNSDGTPFLIALPKSMLVPAQ